MNLEANFFDILILLGAIQGFIISTLLFTSKQKTLAKNLLAWLLLLISLACLNIFLLETQFFGQSDLVRVIGAILPLLIIMPIGPLLYFYVKALLDPQFRLSTQQKRHFYLAVLDLVPYLVALIYVVGALLKVVDTKGQANWGYFIDVYNMYFDIPRWITISGYLWATYKVIMSSQNGKQKAWPKQLIIGFAIFQILWLGHLIPYIIPGTSNILLGLVGWYPIYVPLMILVYWLGINGYFRGPISANKASQTALLDPKIKQQTLLALDVAMKQERLFLNATLSLQDIVKHTNLTQKTISSVLNQHLGKSFNEYINEYRIEEVKQRLLDPAFQHLTIMGIAYECGFNSQATFQRAFKSITQQSPKQFRQLMIEKSR